MADLGDNLCSGIVFVVEEVRVLLLNSHDHRLRVRSGVQIASTSKLLSVLELGIFLEPFDVGRTSHLVLINCKVLFLWTSWSLPEVLRFFNLHLKLLIIIRLKINGRVKISKACRHHNGAD